MCFAIDSLNTSSNSGEDLVGGSCPDGFGSSFQGCGWVVAADLISRGFTDVAHVQGRFPELKETGTHQSTRQRTDHPEQGQGQAGEDWRQEIAGVPEPMNNGAAG